jgi:N-acetylglucosamine-6-phosphate deacetylase
MEDIIDEEHYGIYISSCDYNGDGVIEVCEVHRCIVDTENAWRVDFCPNMTGLYCDCPFVAPECEGAWNCEDIYGISADEINLLDENYDGVIDLASEMDEEHYSYID